MTSDDWVFERQRDYPLSYVLTGADREYLQSKRKSDHPRSDPEERIQNRVEKLPDRIQDLLIDIWLLDDDDRFSGTCWSEIKRDIGGISQQPPIVDEFINLDEIHNSEYGFGYKLGSALKSLQNPSRGKGDLWLLWGLTAALIGEPIEQHPDERVSFSLFRDFFEERFDKREQKIKQKQEEKTDKRYEIRMEKIDRIQDILIEYCLEPNAGITEALFRGINADPVESTEEFCMKLESFLKETPIEQTTKLKHAVESDLDAVSDKSIQGVSAQTVFEAVLAKSTYGHPAKRTELNRYIDDEIDKRSFTRTLKFLANKYDRYQWPRYSLITKSELGWEISRYGLLVAYCRQGPHHGTTWMYKPWTFPDYEVQGWKEYVLPAINEISTGEYEYRSILKYNPHFR